MWKYANRQLRELVAYEPGKPVEDLARELGIPHGDIIKLASNENPLGPSPKARQAMIETLERSHFYPDGGGYYLREAIAERTGTVISEEFRAMAQATTAERAQAQRIVADAEAHMHRMQLKSLNCGIASAPP